MKAVLFSLLVTFIFSLQISAFQNDDLDKAKQLISEKKFDAAITLFEKIIDVDEKNHEAYFELGKAYMSLNDAEEATECFEETIDLQDENADYHFWLGRAIGMDAQTSNVFSQALMASDILEEFERTVELDPTHIPGRMGVIGFYTNAPGIMGGDLDKAKLNAIEVIELDEAKGRMALARVYLKEEKMDSVEIQIKILEEKFGTEKSAASFYNSLGYYYLGQDSVDKAIVAFEKQVELNPKSANAYDSLGDGYKAAKRYEDAIAQYKKALEINPEFTASANNIEELQKIIKPK
ncbi:MAG: tetratricopeptide repeat protein [Melioribacteraceae bacterium]|jgi:tetratricopeptide (TPR) repeat protein|nr:tetratricopeptide repeat protein [Melioribacteraceae bacterium]